MFRHGRESGPRCSFPCKITRKIVNVGLSPSPECCGRRRFRDWLPARSRKPGSTDLRCPEKPLDRSILQSAQPSIDVFHSVFHSCGNLGEQTEGMKRKRAESRKSEAGNVAQGRDNRSFVDTPFQRRLVLTVRQTRLSPAFANRLQRGRLKGHDEGEAHLPAQYPSAQKNARLSGTHVDEKRPDRPQAAPGKGTEAPDRRRRTVD